MGPTMTAQTQNQDDRAFVDGTGKDLGKCEGEGLQKEYFADIAKEAPLCGENGQVSGRENLHFQVDPNIAQNFISDTYALIDKETLMLWDLQNLPDLDTSRATRSQHSVKMDKEIEKRSGYGELTFKSMEKICRQFIELGLGQLLSSFLDIGSGFGKPTLHTATLTSVPCSGVDIVPCRVHYSSKLLHTLKQKYSQNVFIMNLLMQTNFYLVDDTLEDYNNYTHFYSYNLLFGQENNKAVATALNNTKNFKVLAWYLNLKQTVDLGLNGIILAKQFKVATTGNEEQLGVKQDTVYFYVKENSQEFENLQANSSATNSTQAQTAQILEQQPQFKQPFPKVTPPPSDKYSSYNSLPQNVSGITEQQSTGGISHEYCNKLIEELKYDKNKLEEKLDSKDCELIKLRGIDVRLEERDKQLTQVTAQLKEWMDTANKLINSKADFDEWRQRFKDMSAKSSQHVTPQQSNKPSPCHSEIDQNMEEEENGIYCCYCSCHTSKQTLEEHWFECELKIRFNDIVSKFGREWKETIIRLEDYADHISRHPEFNNMFSDFIEVARTQGEEIEGQTQAAIAAITVLKNQLIATASNQMSFETGSGNIKNSVNDIVVGHCKFCHEKIAGAALTFQTGSVAPTGAIVEHYQLCPNILNYNRRVKDLAALIVSKPSKFSSQFIGQIQYVTQTKNLFYLDLMLTKAFWDEREELKIFLEQPGYVNELAFPEVQKSHAAFEEMFQLKNQAVWQHQSSGIMSWNENAELVDVSGLLQQNNLTQMRQSEELYKCCDCDVVRTSIKSWRSHAAATNCSKADQFIQGKYCRTVGGTVMGKRKMKEGELEKLENEVREIYKKNEEAFAKRKREEKMDNKEEIKKGKKNPALVAKRKMSMEDIISYLREHQNELATVQEINTKLFYDFPVPNNFKLKPIIIEQLSEAERLAGHFPQGKFNDGFYFPKTKLTDTQAKVNAYFEDVQIKTKKIGRTYQKEEADATNWFIKLDEDQAPRIGAIKASLLKLMRKLRADLRKAGEEYKVFICQFDVTQDYKGYFYCNDYAAFASAFEQEIGFLAPRNKYKSTSTCLQLLSDPTTKKPLYRYKIYNKTVNPLFSPETVQKAIGMGSSAFFHSSLAYYTRHNKAVQTGRTRIEQSNYCYSVADEEAFLSVEPQEDMHAIIANICERQGTQYFRLIPFARTWSYFFDAIKKHFFLFADRKVAVVYWYDKETCKFIGPLYDSGPRFKENDCIKRYSIFNKEATVVAEEGTYVAKKKTNKHQFPIPPLNVAHEKNRHAYPELQGWAYDQDPSEIELELVEDYRVSLVAELIDDIQAENEEKKTNTAVNEVVEEIDMTEFVIEGNRINNQRSKIIQREQYEQCRFIPLDKAGKNYKCSHCAQILKRKGKNKFVVL